MINVETKYCVLHILNQKNSPQIQSILYTDYEKGIEYENRNELKVENKPA